MGLTADNWWNRTRYRLYAPIYDVVASPLEAGRRRAIEAVDIEPGDRVLIPGCGTGSDLAFLPDDVSVVAVDVTPAMVERTRARAEDLRLDVEVRTGDAQDLDVEADAFDAVLLHLILTVVPDPDSVAAEAARALSPDGQVSIFDKFVPAGSSPSLARRAVNPLARLLFSETTRQLEPMFADTGIEVERRAAFLRGLYTVAVGTPSAGDTFHEPVDVPAGRARGHW